MTQKDQAANEKPLLTSRKVMKLFFYLIFSRSFGRCLAWSTHPRQRL